MNHSNCVKNRNDVCQCYNDGYTNRLQESKNMFFQLGKEAGRMELAQELMKEDAGCQEIGQNEKTRYLWLMVQLEQEAGLNIIKEKETTGKNTH